MLKPIHVDMTRQALGDVFAPAALEAIIRANLGQDSLRGLLRSEFHFDNNAFAEGQAYVDSQRSEALEALAAQRAPEAWAAFGRLIHTVQDFYSHSNYVELWLEAQGDGARPAPADIDPADPALLASPRLHSGKIYYPREILYFFPGLQAYARSILPADSHAHMNLDSADRGEKFPYAYVAAVKRTRLEFDVLKAELSPEALQAFAGETSANLRNSIYDLRTTNYVFVHMP